MLLVDDTPAPGIETPRLAGSTLSQLKTMRSDPLALFTRAFREHGGVVRLSLVTDALLLTEPDAVQHVLKDRHTNYGRTYVYRRMKRLGGEGLLTNEGSGWMKQRRLASPAFHKRRLATLHEAMVRRTGAMLAGWSGGTLDLGEQMVQLTMAIAGETLFSTDLTGEASEVGEAAAEALRITNQRTNQIVDWPQLVPTPQNLRFGRAKAVLDEVVERVIAERRAGAARDNLLQMFMDAQDQDTGERMSDQQVRDEVLTMLLAGHETTAHALTWTLALLSKHPEHAGRVLDEVNAVLGDGPPSAQQLMSLKYTRQVIDESMRLYPPAWLVGREALEDDVILGHSVPAGTDVLISPWLVHRHPAHWPNPEAFDPARFDEAAVEKRHRMAYLPFVAGPRKCIGYNFALMELMTIVPMVLQAFQLDLAVGTRLDAEPTLTLRPANPIVMHAQRRQQRAA